MSEPTVGQPSTLQTVLDRWPILIVAPLATGAAAYIIARTLESKRSGLVGVVAAGLIFATAWHYKEDSVSPM